MPQNFGGPSLSIGVLILCISFFIGSFPAYANQEQANSHIISGIEAMERDDFHLAATHFDAARHVIGARLPVSFDFHRGRALMGAGRYAEAMVSFSGYKTRSWRHNKKYDEDAEKLQGLAHAKAHEAVPMPHRIDDVDFLLGSWCGDGMGSVVRFEKKDDGAYYSVLDSGTVWYQWTLKDLARNGGAITFREIASTTVNTNDAGIQTKSFSDLGRATIEVLSSSSLTANRVTPYTNTKIPSPPKRPLRRCR